MSDGDDVLAPFRAALDRWLWATWYRGHLPTTEWAVAPDAVVVRHVVDDPERPGVQRLVGAATINDWLALGGPAERWFTLVPGTLALDDAVAEVRYELTVMTTDHREPDGWVKTPWHNHGTWRVTLAPDGRIALLEHIPDALPR